MIMLFLRLCLLISTWMLSQAIWAGNTQRIVEQAINQIQQPTFFGMNIVEMKTGKTIYQNHANYHFTPASTLKLFTAIAALTELGAGYRYHTWLLTDASAIKKQTLPGNLWIKFTGDPSLTANALKTLLNRLKQQGITRIRGHVYIDDSTFDRVPYPPGWLWDDFSYAYAAPLSSVIIDKNATPLLLQRNKNHVQLSTPKLPFKLLHFNNQLRVVKNNQGCPIAIYSHFNNHYQLQGCFAKAWKKTYRQLAITNPVLYARRLVKQDLAAAGIHYKGRVTVKKAPKKTLTLEDHRSRNLSHLVTEMLKESDNLIANALFKTLGQHYFMATGSWQNGAKALEKILASRTHINFKHTLITDGAGLSRYNLVTPKQLTQLLSYAYHDVRIEPELLHALPIAGKDGTLEYRMRLLKPAYSVRAKTGTMTGITGLAGFITTKNHQVYAYSMIANHFVGSSKPYRRLEDRICQALAQSEQLS
jgi:D-alanyl-D-alanine carboxypeptidase/D-alanyl-D-alanine-endopeptidase (penicillin-binding protein 4)